MLMILLLSMFLFDTVQARSSCDDWVCIESEVRDEVVYQYARNLKPWPLTVSVRNRTENLKQTSSRSITRSLGPRESVLLARMPIARSDRPHRLRYWYDWSIGRQDVDHDDQYLYALPYAEGKRYRILQGFGPSFSHKGMEQYAIDFDMQIGTPVHAARDGVVVDTESRHSKGCWEKGCGRYANYIVILHDDGSTGEYYHLDRDGVDVKVGQRVRRGQAIGRSGNTGHTTRPHLHFAVYRAASWGQTQSIPFRLITDQGIVERPRRGMRLAVRHQDG